VSRPSLTTIGDPLTTIGDPLTTIGDQRSLLGNKNSLLGIAIVVYCDRLLGNWAGTRNLFPNHLVSWKIIFFDDNYFLVSTAQYCSFMVPQQQTL